MNEKEQMTYNQMVKLTSCNYDEGIINLEDLNITRKIKRREIIGFILKELRSVKGLTQYEIAEEINIAQNQYQRYETGNAMPSIEILIRIANIYKVSLDYISGANIKKHSYETDKILYQAGTEKEDILNTKIHITQLQLIYAKLEATYIEKVEEELEELDKL